MSNPKIVQIAVDTYDTLGLDESGNLYKLKSTCVTGAVVTHKWVLLVDNNDTRTLKEDLTIKINAGIATVDDFLPGRN